MIRDMSLDSKNWGQNNGTIYFANFLTSPLSSHFFLFSFFHPFLTLSLFSAIYFLTFLSSSPLSFPFAYNLSFLLNSYIIIGGRGVIDGIEKNLNLTPRHVEASRHTLYTYGKYAQLYFCTGWDSHMCDDFKNDCILPACNFYLLFLCTYAFCKSPFFLIPMSMAQMQCL